VHFTTPALSRIGDRLKDIEADYRNQQSAVAAKAMETVLTYLPVVETAGALIAQLDVLTGFATAAALAPSAYVRPEMLDMGTGVLELKDARHPCVELMDNMSFIANSYDFQKATSAMQIITGPNMGGKSTYIRGLGCIVVMAQVGSFVPCSSARVSIVDCILARVGAGDAVQKGVSTFMAEMLEASVILQTATPNSLLIIDELGRGTSTFDGFGLAWAISEYIVSKIGCLCVFASHFHELTALADKYPQVVNKHVSAHVMDGQLVMLFDVKNGPCKESFGVHVAAMAKFPQCVIDEAKRKASELESLGHDVVSEEGKAKMAKVTKCVDTFAALPLMSMDANEIKSQVTSAVDIAL
jgi:DNA mismatch repair protein MSH2